MWVPCLDLDASMIPWFDVNDGSIQLSIAWIFRCHMYCFPLPEGKHDTYIIIYIWIYMVYIIWCTSNYIPVPEGYISVHESQQVNKPADARGTSIINYFTSWKAIAAQVSCSYLVPKYESIDMYHHQLASLPGEPGGVARQVQRPGRVVLIFMCEAWIR